MFLSHNLALALAAAILDVTVGYPLWFAALFGSVSTWIGGWYDVVDGAETPGGDAGGLAIFLAPILVVAAVLVAVLPANAFGFAVTALIASACFGRQSIDKRARAVVRTWADQGPYEALVAAEALGPNEAETRLAPACAGAIAARFADEVAAPTIFLALGGPIALVFVRAIGVAGRIGRERRDDAVFGQALTLVETWTLTPAAWAGAFWLNFAAGGQGKATPNPAGAFPTAKAEAAMLRALGPPPERDDPGYLRKALALYRRAAALEIAALAALTAAAFLIGEILPD